MCWRFSSPNSKARSFSYFFLPRDCLSTYLFAATLVVGVVTLIFPFTPAGRLFGFGRLPISFLLILTIIIALYLTAAEITKPASYRKVKY